jgi:beta-mannosidase
LLRKFVGDDWVWRKCHLDPNDRDEQWIRATVPGSVHHDLRESGAIPDPNFDLQSKLVEWVPERTWMDKKTFTVPRELEGKNVRLRFEGVDYEATFFLNGEELGTHRGMFTPADFDVGGKLKYGEENLLAVVIEPAPKEEPQVGRTSEVRTHKTRMNSWWDFCPRMIHLGVWDSVHLDATGPARIEDVAVRATLSEDLSRADVSIGTRRSSDRVRDVEIETTLRLRGRVIAREKTKQRLKAGDNSLEQAIAIDRPRLWWPNGCGEAALASAIEELDPERTFLPSSPSGPSFSNTLESIEKDPRGQHDVHGPWEHQGLEGPGTAKR